MELPTIGPFVFSPIPAAPQPGFAFNPPQISQQQFTFSGSQPLPVFGGTSDGDRSKLRRVKVDNSPQTQRIPMPFESEEARQTRQYNEFLKHYPTLQEQLVALRTTANEDEIRTTIIAELFEQERVKEAFYFIMEMRDPIRKHFLLKDLALTLADIDAMDEIRAYFHYLTTCPQGQFLLEAAKLAVAMAYIEPFETTPIAWVRACEIYVNLTTPHAKSELLREMFIVAIFPTLTKGDVAAAIRIAREKIIQPILEDMFFLMGTVLIETKKPELAPFILNEMTVRKDEFITYINNQNK